MKKSSKSLTKRKESNDSNISRSPSNTSFVLIKVEPQHVPFLSLQFLFQSSISYLDRMRILQKFKEKLGALNLKNLSPNLESPSSTPNQNSLIAQNTNKLVQSTSQTFKINQSNTNLNQLDPSLLKQKTKNECCYLLQKPNLFDAIKTAFLDEKYLNLKHTKTGQQVIEMKRFKTQILNFMERKEFKWNINNSFSYQTSLNIKETIIDTFVRIRLKEGFRCLFQNSKIAVFSIQLTMFDSGEFGNSQQVPSSQRDSEAVATEQISQQTPMGEKQKKVGSLINKETLTKGCQKVDF